MGLFRHVGLLCLAVASRNLAAAEVPVVFHADHALTDEAALRTELAEVHARLQEELGVPPLSQAVHVFLFHDTASYRDGLRAAGLRATSREAVFLRRDGQPFVFALRSADLANTLRHEFTHAVLNDAHPGLPLWLDEGLAEFYEPADDTGEQPLYRRLLRQQPRLFWRCKPERMTRWKSMGDMRTLEYAEAWSWTFLLLAEVPGGREVVSDYLRALRERRDAGDLADLLPRLLGDPRTVWEREFRP